MAETQDARAILKRLAEDPKLLTELLNAGSNENRKKVLVQAGIQPGSFQSLRTEVERLTSAGARAESSETKPTGGKPPEAHVAAVASALAAAVTPP